MLQLETTHAKTNVRRQILGQSFDWLKIQTATKIQMVSLPAEGWKWEDNMVNHFNLFYPDKKAELFCYEREFSKHIHFPYPIDHNESDYVKQPTYVSQNGNVQVVCSYGQDFNYLDDGETPSIVWADYCGYPSTDLINDFGNAIQAGSLFYVTFSQNWRVPKSVDNTLKLMSKIMSNDDALIRRFEAIIKKHLGNAFTRVYRCSYIGGWRAPMITVGWHFVANSPIKSQEHILHVTGQSKVMPKNPFLNEVKKMLKAGISDESIFKILPSVTKMQLAGAKAALSRARNK